MRLAAWSVFLALVSTSCSFDAKLPTDVEVSCDANTPCPSGYFCQLTLGKCVSSENPDKQAPQVVSATFSRSLLARGVELSLELVVSEPLGVAPRVALAQASRSGPMQLEETVEGEQPRYRFTYTVGAADGEGPASIYADLLDRAGNESNAVLLGSVTMDFTAPSPTSLAYVAPRGSDGGVVMLRLDEEVQVRVTMSEPVAAGSTLLAVSTDCDAGSVDYVLTSNQAGLLDFVVPAPAGEPNCSYAFHLSGVTDLAGNGQSPEDIEVGAPYRIEDSPPAITGLASWRPLDGGWTAASRFSRQPGFNEVGLQFGLGASAIAMTASLDDEVLAGCDLSACASADGGDRLCTCVRPMVASDTEGTHAVLVSARDVAGNVRFVSIPVGFDFTAPLLVSSAASPALAKLGDDVVYSVTPNEPLAGTPTVRVTGPGTFDLSFLSATYAFHRVTTSGDADGTYQVAVTMTDEVGNTATDVPGVAFRIDVSPPTITSVTPQATRYSAVTGFNQVQVGIAIAESIDSGGRLIATLGGRPMSCGAYSATAPNYVCTYTVTSTDAEGTVPIQVQAVDAAGNATFGSSSVTLDFTPPALGSSSLVLSPSSGCPVNGVGAASVGATATETFTVTELLASDPVVTASKGTWTIAKDSSASAGLFYEYDLTLGAADSSGQGAFSPQVTLTDLVGNTSAPLALPGITNDTEPPAAPAVDTPDAVVYQRVPWGFDEGRTGSFAPKTFRVIGAAGSIDAETTQLLAYDGPGPATSAQIGRLAVGRGSPWTMELNRADRAEVYVASVDTACNTSPAVKVRDVSWTASMGYKTSGSTLENPLVFTTTSRLEESLVQAPVINVEPGDPQLARLQSADGQAMVRAAELSWRQRANLANPSGSVAHALAYDSSRGKVVLFGGYGLSQETWEWDGATETWTNRTPPANNPPARGWTAMAYDSSRSRVVLFGGSLTSGAGQLQDTWEWDGETGTWTNRTPTLTSPPARYGHAMAYDSARARVVLFGGTGVGLLADVWEWDGASGAWVNRTPALQNPPARTYAAMVHDTARGRVLLFGGAGQTGLLQDTWEWDGASGTWTNRTPAGVSPPARRSHAMAWDAARGRALLFGGFGSSGPRQDAWEWDGSTGTWTNRTPAVTSPPARYGHAMAYDRLRGIVVLFGGWDAATTRLQDTWGWNGASGTWTNRSPAGSAPPARSSAAMAYDSARRKMVLFGGLGAPGVLQDVWEWDATGGGWVNRTPAGTSPPARCYHSAAYDSARGRVVVFGGFANGVRLQDTWEWDGASGTWANRTPATNSPPARSSFGMAYDSARGRVVVFGGAPGLLQDTWEWDGASGAWSNRTPSVNNPAARYLHAMAYDAARARVVLFGGSTASGGLRDTWEWDGASGTWTNRTPAVNNPLAGADAAMAYDSARGRTVLFGGNASGASRDTWEWDGASGGWSNRTPPANNPAARTGHVMAYDVAQGTMVLFGGLDSGSARLQDTWELSVGAGEAPGQLLRIPFAATGVTQGWTVQAVSSTVWAGGTGFPAGTATHGSELRVWDYDAWRVVATNADAASSPNLVQWSTNDPAVIAPLLRLPALTFAVRPSAPNGTGLGQIAVDYAEVTLRYRLP